MLPFFSVIIPLYNKEAYIIETLNSVLKQDFNDYEIIIINDGSTDNSLNIITNLNLKNVLIHSQKNNGVSVARNNGIQLAQGKYIAFLDADDYWFPNHLNELHRAITAFPKHSIFCNNYKREVKKNKFKPNKFSFLPKPSAEKLYIIDNYFKSSLIADIAWTSAVCIKKELLLKDFLFDPYIMTGQDTDLWIRLGINNSFIFNNIETSAYLKYIKNTLSDSKNIDNRVHFIYKNEKSEKNIPFLKNYLDQNRFAIATEFKLAGNYNKFKLLKNQINLNNLPLKRLIILHLPQWFLKILLNFR